MPSNILAALAGLLQGTSSGIGTLQQDEQKRKQLGIENDLKQKAEARQEAEFNSRMDELKRNNVQESLGHIDPFGSHPDIPDILLGPAKQYAPEQVQSSTLSPGSRPGSLGTGGAFQAQIPDLSSLLGITQNRRLPTFQESHTRQLENFAEGRLRQQDEAQMYKEHQALQKEEDKNQAKREFDAIVQGGKAGDLSRFHDPKTGISRLSQDVIDRTGFGENYIQRLPIEDQLAFKAQEQANSPSGQNAEILPGTIDNIAKMVLLNQTDLDSAVSTYFNSRTQSQGRQAVLKKINEIDPGFNPAQSKMDAQNRTATTQAFAPGGQRGTQVQALNTLSSHMKLLLHAAEAMHNGHVPLANELVSKLDQETGGTGITNFNTVIDRVAPELTRLWRGASGSEQDITRDIKNIAYNQSPEQRIGSFQNLGNLIKGQVDSLKSSQSQGLQGHPSQMAIQKFPEWKSAVPNYQGVQVGTPDTDSILEELTKPYTVTNPKDQQTYRFSTKAALDYFKQQNGIK